MQAQFLFHNSHLEDPKKFAELDPQLRRLKRLTYVYHAPLIDELPIEIPGIYTLGGGRQIGKTTLLKQWMLKLLDSGVAPNKIAFFTGEVIDNHHILIETLRAWFNNQNTFQAG